MSTPLVNSNFVFLELILDYIDVLIWPLVLTIICFWFKGEIARLIDRMIKGKFPGGVTVDFSPSQTAPDKETPEEIKESANILKGNMGSKKGISTGFVTTEELQKQIEDLINQIANLQAALIFERVYKTIFGSQIKLLEELRMRGITGISYEEVASYYQQVKIKWSGLSSYSLENYLNYLKDSKLIEVFDEDKRKYKITPLGIDFLEYIEKLKYSKEKIY